MASHGNLKEIEIEMANMNTGLDKIGDFNAISDVDSEHCNEVDTEIYHNNFDGPQTGVEEVDIAKNIERGVAPNAYVGKRNFIHQLMDVALMMANVSQLKALIVSENNQHYYLILTFICLSITMQVVFTICMLVIWSVEKTLEEQSKPELKLREDDPPLKRKERIATWLDRVGSILVLFIIVSNVFIAGFGIESHGKIITQE